MAVQTTDRLDLPYPDSAEDADVPSDIKALAEKVEDLLAQGGGGAFLPGDLKYSVRSTDHDRWLKLDGRELSQEEIEAALSLETGDAAALVALLGTGASSIYGDAASGKVKLPDVRRQIPMSAGPSGDGSGSFSARPLKGTGSSGGVESVTLSAAQSGLRSHEHGSGTLTAASHTHGSGSLAAAAHSHGAGSFVNGLHLHGLGADEEDVFKGWAGGRGPVSPVAVPVGEWGLKSSAMEVSVSGGVSGWKLGLSGNTFIAGGEPITGTSGVTGADVSGSTGSTSPSVSGDTGTPKDITAGGTAASESHENMPPYRVLGYGFIRV